LLVCAVYSDENYENNKRLSFDRVIFHNKSRGYQHILNSLFHPCSITKEDHVFLLYQTSLKRKELEMESGGEIEVSFQLCGTAQVNKCRIHPLVDESSVMEEDESRERCII
jgi:hypothetical protein